MALGRAIGSLRALTLGQSLCDSFVGQDLQGSGFYQAIIALETQRIKASSSGKQLELSGALRRLIMASDAHVADLYSSGKGQAGVRGFGHFRPFGLML